MKREFRVNPKAQIRAKGKTGIEGYAAVFNQLSVDLGWFREIIMPGAFAACLAGPPPPDVRALFNHNPSAILGRTVAQTLRLTEDGIGLHFDNDLPDTQVARDLLTSIERGDISQCSFGFMVRKQKWSEEEDAGGNFQLIREVHQADVFDVSPVTFPAYPQTSVDTRESFRRLWPDGEPESVRRFAKMIGCGRHRQDDDEENENGCACECDACQDDRCEECSFIGCADDDCRGAGCPMQSGENSAPHPPHAAVIDAGTRAWMEARLRLAASS